MMRRIARSICRPRLCCAELFWAWLIGAGLAAVSPARATVLDLGNVAPGSGAIRVLIDDLPVAPALRHTQFASIDRAAGTLLVRVVADGTGAEIAAAVVELEAAPDSRPMLVLTGDGASQPYALQFHPQPSAAAAKTHGPSTIFAHHLAPYPGAAAVNALEAQVSCSGYGGPAGSSDIGFTVRSYGQSAGAGFDSPHDSHSCRIRVADAVFGSFDLTATLTAQTLRFLLIGDGSTEPFRILFLADGVVQRVAEASAPPVGAVIRSVDFWYDLSRPAQGVSLYEIPGSRDVFGTWFTHDSSGKAIWYLFDGVATTVPGQRELVVYRPSRSINGPVRIPAGSARLFYVDCNQAELRIFLGERDFRTLRLRRSRDVLSCDALK